MSTLTVRVMVGMKSTGPGQKGRGGGQWIRLPMGADVESCRRSRPSALGIFDLVA